MTIIVPIVVVALILGLVRNKMNGALWIVMLLTILAALGRYSMKH